MQRVGHSSAHKEGEPEEIVCSQGTLTRCALPAASCLVQSVQISVFCSPQGKQLAENTSEELCTCGVEAERKKPRTSMCTKPQRLVFRLARVCMLHGFELQINKKVFYNYFEYERKNMFIEVIGVCHGFFSL